ncbi:MAG TPA: MFS transporter [Deltaproteobacteria bacterium]|nr:MFS transporter [Deltaproteobacteria bacterium]
MNTFKIYRWAMIIIIAVLYFFVCLHRHSPTVVARDLTLSLHINAVTLGIIASSYFYLYAAMQPIVGFLADTKGPRKVMPVFFFISAAGSLIFGLAPNAITAVFGRALVGAGLAGIFVSALKIFSRWYPASQFASLTGVMVTIGGLGGLAASAPLTYLVVLLGWRGSFVAIGIFSAAMAFLAWIVVRDSPIEKGWPAIYNEVSSPVGDGEKISLLRRMVTVFGDLNFCLICLSVFLIYGAALSFQGLWAVPYLMDVFGADKVRAGLLFMAWPLGFGIGGLALGYLSDRFNLNRKNTLLAGLALSSLQWLLLIFLKEREYLFITAPLFFLFGLTAGGVLPLYFSMTRDLFPLQLMGTSTGLMNGISFLGTAVYMPLTGSLFRTAESVPSASYNFEAYRMLLIVFLASYSVAFIAMLLYSNHKASPVSPT